RAHVLATRDDDLLQPAGDEEVSVRVELAEIAAMEPAAAQRLAGGRRIVEVAAHHCRTATDDLAPGTRRQDATLAIHDRQLDALVRTADRPRADERVATDGHGETVRALGLSVRLDDLGAREALRERLLHLERGERAAHRDLGDRRSRREPGVGQER